MKKVVDDDEGPGRQIISLSLYYAIRRITNFPSLSSDYFLHYIRLKYLLLHSFAFPFHHTTLYFPNRIPCKKFFCFCSVVEKDLLFFSCIFCAHHPYFVLRIPPLRICPPSLFHLSQADCIIEFCGFGAHHELDINRGYLEITVGKSFHRVLKL